MRHVGFLLISILSMLGGAPAVYAQKRVALVMGNSAYQHSGKLANPTNDASDMVDVLKAHAFQVVEGYDLGQAARVRASAHRQRGGVVLLRRPWPAGIRRELPRSGRRET
jgi:hypothetical protein